MKNTLQPIGKGFSASSLLWAAALACVLCAESSIAVTPASAPTTAAVGGSGQEGGGAPPKVDFSYAFATPHRITVGRPTSSDRTLLDLQPGSLRMSWNYMDLTHFPLATYMIPMKNSFTWGVDITPQIDGKPFAKSRWTRVEGFLPALENRYDDPRGSMHVEVVGAETATLAKVQVTNTDTVPHQFLLLCETHHTYVGVNYAWIDPGRWAGDCLFAGQEDRADRVLMLGLGADRWTSSADGRAVAPGTLAFIWDLKPSEKSTGWVVRPYRAYESDLPALRKHEWAREMETAKQEWRDLINRTGRVAIPDPDVANALHACFADLFIMREPAAEGYIAVVPGTQVYRAAGAWEASIAAVAMDQFGLHRESAEGHRICLETQGPDGEWADPQGWGALMCSDFQGLIDWTSVGGGHRKRKSSLKPYSQGICGSMCSRCKRSGRPS